MRLGDTAYCMIQQIARNGLVVKILCTIGKCSRLLSDMNIKVNLNDDEKHAQLVNRKRSQTCSYVLGLRCFKK